MTIQAISGVKNNGYTNVSFEGRKNKSSKNPQITSPMKAVPLAVLVALSPMTTTNAEQIMRSNVNTVELAQTQDGWKTTVLETKTFKTNRGDLKLELINRKNDDVNANINSIHFEYKDGGLHGKLDGREKMEYRLYDDSGVRFATMTASELRFKDQNGNKFYIEDENVDKYIKSLEDRKIISTYTGSDYDNYNYSTEDGKYVFSWYSQAKRQPEKFGAEFRPAKYKTAMGTYEIHLYDSEKVLTLKRDDGPELKIKGLQIANNDFTLRGNQSVSVPFGKIIVEYKGKEHFLVDDELFLFMAEKIMTDPLSKTILPEIGEKSEHVDFKVHMDW